MYVQICITIIIMIHTKYNAIHITKHVYTHEVQLYMHVRIILHASNYNTLLRFSTMVCIPTVLHNIPTSIENCLGSCRIFSNAQSTRSDAEHSAWISIHSFSMNNEEIVSFIDGVACISLIISALESKTALYRRVPLPDRLRATPKKTMHVYLSLTVTPLIVMTRVMQWNTCF